MKNPFVKSTGSFAWALLLTASMVTFSACNNDDDDNNNNPTPQLNTVDQQFMETAKRGNNVEIKTSQLALTNSMDTSIQNFAQMMIVHHSAANHSLDSLARLNNVTLPDSSQLDSAGNTLLGRLTGMRDSTSAGNEVADSVRYTFSREYINGQIQAHTKAHTDYQTYINNPQAQNAGVKSYATKTLPIVQSHLQEAREISTDIGMTPQ